MRSFYARAARQHIGWRLRFRSVVHGGHRVAKGADAFRLLYLFGWPRSTTAADLHVLCVPFGLLVDVCIEHSPYTGAQCSFGPVEVFASEAAGRAAREWHGKR
jgi:hypothetical protein